MKIVCRQEYAFVKKALREETWQAPFPEKTNCKNCSSDSLPLLVIGDDEGFISTQKEFVEDLGDGIFPHDCLSIVLYLCPKCGEMTALWNQG